MMCPFRKSIRGPLRLRPDGRGVEVDLGLYFGVQALNDHALSYHTPGKHAPTPHRINSRVCKCC